MDKLENGHDIVRDIVLRNLESLVRRYTKQVLERLEDQRLLTPEIRKIVLDGFADMYRAIVARS
jgi:hypothetical protein